MIERTVVVASGSGLHARPAALFTEAVRRCGLPVTIARPGQDPADATSILRVLGLGLHHGEQVTLRAEGPDADRVLGELVALLATDLDQQ